MKSSLSLLLPLLSTLSSVSAHGFLSSVTIAGKAYTGPAPASDSSAPSVIREVSTAFPNKGASNSALTCGANATRATLVASANPGDSLAFEWKGADGSNWPHNTGPMLTYLASCGTTTCDKFDASQAKWFKIQQVGKKNGNDGPWVQADLMTGSPALATLPATLAPGSYLLRHEIIALHLANSLGGAEFYPACAQITVGGSGTGKPTADELVSIPGAYKDADPGIFDPNVFNPGDVYQFPGPPVAAFVGTGGSSGSSTGASVSASKTKTATGAPQPTATDTPQPTGTAPSTSTSTSASGKSCKAKKRAVPASADVVVRPRHLSRVMRKIGDGIH